MQRELRPGDRRAATVIALSTTKRAARSGGVWGVLFGLLVINDALSYHSTIRRWHRERRSSGALVTIPRSTRSPAWPGGWTP